MKWIEWIKKLLIKIHEWIQKQWCIVSILIYTSSIWFSLILNFFGEILKLTITNKDGKKEFTFLGIILTVGITLFSFLVVIAQRYYEYSKLNTDIDKRKLYVLEEVDRQINKICDNKYITLKKKIWNIKNNDTLEIPEIISNPCEQLKHIIEKINNCLCELLRRNENNINESELYITLYYNFPMEGDIWKKADSISPEKGLDIKELLTENSTFSRVLKSKKAFLFYNSKEQARKIDSYISDGEDQIDEKHELKGSIACYKIIIEESGQELIKAVLSISTYNKKFVNDNNDKIIDNVKFNMDEYVLKPFVKRIRRELCLLYLSVLYNKHK